MARDVGAAWVWVLAKRSLIKKTAMKMTRGKDYEEVLSRLILECVESFDLLRDEGGTPASFVHWRCRKVLLYMKRERARFLLVDNDVLHQKEAVYGSQDQLEKRLRVSEVFAVATPKQAVACFTVLNGLSGKEIKSRENMSPQARNNHLYKLGNSFHRKRGGGNGG